ncbi:DUF4347 domain-containing protein [Vacuolonema iberomarrocanum]|uniref:DUF4347 domain-containing protein n=1 Tax=Vacuolonema iberomarrocanum TaxID=3454632 RepID=UPI0019F7365B|nr:DUF4347 domain-containing protein [filamentous cyanobacterium LEGE 07170]
MKALKIVKAPVFNPFPVNMTIDRVDRGREAIAIFDPSVENYTQLAEGLHPHVTPYLLSPHADGIRQLTSIFQQHTQPLTVYLIAHGSPGTLHLGNTELSLATLQRYSKELKTWFQPHSEWLLYGCNVAAGDAGEEFLAKLHQATGAAIAASTRPVGNAQRGGTWGLDTVLGDMAIALPFSDAVANQYQGVLVTPIDSIIAASADPPGPGLTYEADEVVDVDGDGVVDTYTYNFQSGPPNDLVISGVTAAGSEFSIVQVVDTVELSRVDNANVTGEREIFWYERETIDTVNNTLDLNPSFVGTLQEALTSQTVNRGADNIFANEGSANVNNIERVDFVITDGISTTADLLDDIGFLLLERGGNDPLNVAPITAIDAAGNPTAYGPLVAIEPGDWGGSGIEIESAVLNDQGNGGQPSLSALPPAQELSGIFLSFESLGVTGGQTFFGYSVFPEDVGTDLVGLSDANLATPQASGAGGLDLVTGSAVFSRALLQNNPPALNLDPSNVTGGADDRNFNTTFTTGGAAVEITADDATAIDPDNVGVDIETLTITVNTPDGADEVLNFAGTALTLTNGSAETLTFGGTDFDVVVTGAAGNSTVTITNDAGGAMPNVDLRTLLRSLTYDNTSANPDTTARVFSFVAEDGEATSNTATSTISFDTPGNTAPILNLDPTNVTGGPDNRNFDTTFTVGGNAVEITADDATTVDPDNSGVDIETLTITANTPDGANDVLSFAGTPITLTNGSAATLTFGSTDFDVAVTGGADSATLTITNDAGGAMSNVDLRTLLRSLTYDNTSANPDTTARVFSFVTEDGEANSNTVTSTVTFATTTNTPPVLNLDPSNVTGGVDNRNFEATFIAGGDAIDIAAEDATAVDPNNNGEDIETLAISVNAPDGPNEILNFEGTSLALTDGATTTVTFGSTTFDVSVDASAGNVTINIASTTGGDIPNTDLRRLLRSLSYDNTSASPTLDDRIFTFVANDGVVDSNLVTSTITVQPTAVGPNPPRDCSGGLRLAGNGANNRLVGSGRTDILRGFGGRDEMLGLACPDRLLGGAGNDRLFGGAASDTLDGGSGRDRLSGQNGDDTIFGRSGTDRINGGRGNDQLNGQTDRDYLRGKAGFDQLRGGQGDDGMAGGAGGDRLSGGAGNDQMFGGGGRDRMRGNARGDRMFGGTGNDIVFGQNGDDVIRGEAGRDILQGNAGIDQIFGGDGSDRLFGGALNDSLNGGIGADRLSGQRGNDRLRGGRQRDRLNGGAGNDFIFGGTGADRLLGKGGRDTLRGNSGADELLGGAGRDQMLGGSGNDEVDGGAQSDFLRGNSGADDLFGKAGDDLLVGNRGFDRLNGGDGNDTLQGGGAADRLIGKSGRDVLQGLAGNDRLEGNNGRDTLIGGTGNDVLIGRADGDQIQGGRGADRFVFAGATFAETLRDSLVADPDEIVDFNQAEGDRFSINFTGAGPSAAIPSALFNVGTIVAGNLEAAATLAFRDRNPNQAGNQRTTARQALLFDWRDETYLLVNNTNRSFNPLQDLVVNVTGIELGAGDANRVSLSVNDYFA